MGYHTCQQHHCCQSRNAEPNPRPLSSELRFKKRPVRVGDTIAGRRPLIPHHSWKASLHPSNRTRSLDPTGVLGRCAQEHLEHLASSGAYPVMLSSSPPQVHCAGSPGFDYIQLFLLFGFHGSSRHPVTHLSLLSKMEVPKGHTAQLLSGRAFAFSFSSTLPYLRHGLGQRSPCPHFYFSLIHQEWRPLHGPLGTAVQAVGV